MIGHSGHFKPAEKRHFMKTDERSLDSILGELIHEARSLGRLEQRYDAISDYIRQFNRTANSLAIQSGRLQRLSSSPDPDGVRRTVFNEHRKILLEQARNNSSLRKTSIAEAKWLRREIAEQQSTIRVMTEKLVKGIDARIQ